MTCSIRQCSKPRHQRGYCKGHHARLWKYGDPLYQPLPSTMERFWAKIERRDGCWFWTAGTFEQGYGQFRVGGRTVKAHRFAYEVLVEPVPEGLELDHLCRNRGCVNPSHLEVVTHAENVHRGSAGWNLRSEHRVSA